MQTVVATFDNRQAANSAVDLLVKQGFSPDSVHVKAEPVPGAATTNADAAIGRDQGILASVGHFFSNLFESNAEDAGKYAEAVRRGNAVVIVEAKTDQEVTTAGDVMEHMGAIDLEERAQAWKKQGWTGYDAATTSADADTHGNAQFARQSLPVVHETFAVGKRAVNVGSLRVIKRMSETPVSQAVTLRQERATIQRRSVDREATEADFQNFREGVFEVRETAEEAVISKTARVVEEVVVGKEITESTEQVSDTVRRTDIEVERTPGEVRTRAASTPRQ